jgi:hypothetical protein
MTLSIDVECCYGQCHYAVLQFVIMLNVMAPGKKSLILAPAATTG